MNEQTNFKYNIIKSDIKRDIAQHKLKEGDKILSEAQLCKTYGVSRITATKAINELMMEGYLYRIQGKGTFVKGKSISEGVSTLSGFAQRMKSQNLDLETKVIECSSVQIPAKMAEQFGLSEDKNVILLKRVRIVNHEILCLSISYLVPEIFYWVTLEDMEKESLFDLLEHKYHYTLGNAIQEFEVGYLDKENAKYLQISSKDPCLKLSLYAYVNDQQPAQFEETYYLQNKYSYRILLNSPKNIHNF